MSKEKNNIVEFNKGFQVNIGVFLIFIIILYLVFQIYSSATKKEINAYEVNLGTIVDKNFYQGLALRTEEIIKCDRSGDIIYYENNKSRVGVRSKVYAIDTKGSTVAMLSSENSENKSLSNEDLSGVSNSIESFLGSFNEINFQSTYSFKSDVQEYLSDVQINDMKETYSTQIDEAKNSGAYFDYNAVKPGFLVYTIDGYENKNIDNIKSDDFNAGGISIENLRTRGMVSEGDTAYKLITSEDWQLVIPINEEKANELSPLSNIEVKFTQDNSTTWATSSILTKPEGKYLVLSMDDSMERYASQRFVNVELLLDEKQGLKIPNSAICQKDFYVIPKAYFSMGGNSNELGFFVRSDDKEDRFIIPTIYYETEKGYYVDNEYVSAGDRLLRENSNDSYTIGADIDTLTGVYNINKGYTVFKAIEEIFKNEDYTIVKNQASYSVALYDHIVLDASNVEENEII